MSTSKIRGHNQSFHYNRPSLTRRPEKHAYQNYSIYLRQLADGRYYLFAYFEYVGLDFKKDFAQMIDDPVTKRWWAECVPCLELLTDRASEEIWSPMKEVFHLD